MLSGCQVLFNFNVPFFNKRNLNSRMNSIYYHGVDGRDHARPRDVAEHILTGLFIICSQAKHYLHFKSTSAQFSHAAKKIMTLNTTRSSATKTPSYKEKRLLFSLLHRLVFGCQLG